MSFPERLLQRRIPAPLPGQYWSRVADYRAKTNNHDFVKDAGGRNATSWTMYPVRSLAPDSSYTHSSREEFVNYAKNIDRRSGEVSFKATVSYNPSAFVPRESNETIKCSPALNVIDRTAAWNYMRFNRDIVEEFIMQEIPKDTLERWLIRKTCKEATSEATRESQLARWKFCVHSDKRQLLHTLGKTLQSSADHRPMLYELSKAIADAVQANEFVLFVLDFQSPKEILVQYTVETEQPLLKCAVAEGDTIPGYVAFTRSAVNLNILSEGKDSRFIKGPLLHGKASCALVCVPIVSGSGLLHGVLELTRQASEPQFAEEEMEIISSYLSWGAVALDLIPCEGNLGYSQQKLLTNHVLSILKTLANNCSSSCKNNNEVVFNAVKDAVRAITECEHVALFEVNAVTQELCASMLSITSEQPVYCVQTETQLVNSAPELFEYACEIAVCKGNPVRVPISSGTAGLAVRTGSIFILNSKEECQKINKCLEDITGYSTHSILSVPLTATGKVIGVLEAWNKRRACGFGPEDKASMEAFACLCSSVLLQCQLLQRTYRDGLHWKVTEKMLLKHRTCSGEELEKIKAIRNPLKGDFLMFSSFAMDTSAILSDQKPHMVYVMLSELSRLSQYDNNTLVQFIWAVKKGYQNKQYHNWEHAFCTAQCIYVSLLSESHKRFSELEKVSLFIAALCHDLEHPGHTNHFLKLTASPLAQLYPNSTLENYHLMQTLAILKQNNIFSHLKEDQYRTALSIIKVAILATDIAAAMLHINTVRELTENGKFSWKNHQHRELAYCVLMTASDVSATCKPWEVNKRIVDNLFVEFHQQGDEEKALGFVPAKMMDSDYKDKLPQFQVEFIGNVTIPCCEVLATILPNTKPLLEGALKNLHCWQSY